MDIFEREAIGIRGRFGVDVWEKWLSFQHSQEDFLRNYGVREDRIDGTVLALKRLLKEEGIMADKDYRRANRKRAGLVENSLWFDKITGEVFEVWIEDNPDRVVGYGLTYNGEPLTVSHVAEHDIFTPTHIGLSREGAFSEDEIREWGLQPLAHLDKGTTIEIIERNGLPMPSSLGHPRDARRANRKRAYSGGEMGWENVADGGDPIYGTSGTGPDGFYYSYYVYANEVNLVFEAQNEDTLDPEEVWTFEHGGDIPSDDRLIALGDTMAIEFEETGGVSNPIRRVSHKANRKTADESHNGWTNYETWYVKAIIDNDYDLYMESKNIVNVEHLFNMVDGHPLNDLSYDEMDRVNWDELLEEFDRTANRRANRKRANNALFDRLFSSPGVFSVGMSGDIMAYVDLPSDEIPNGGTSFYWVVIDSNGDEIVGGASSSFEEAKSLAENNLFRLSRELYPESYTSHRANLKVSYSKEDEFEVHDEVVEKFPGGESALADLFGYTNLDQAEINSAKVMPYIEDAVFSRGGDQDDVDFAYDNLEYYFQAEY